MRNLVFDLGNVVLRWNPRFLFDGYFSSAQETDYFLTSVCSPSWNLEQDRRRSFGEGVRLLQELHPDYAAAIAAYDQRWHETLPHVITGTCDLIEELDQAGVPLFAITNFNGEKFRETKQRFPVLSRFRDIVVSGNEGVLKPEPEIFQIFLERHDLKAESCLFIDDNLSNVEAAQKLGFHGHHFTCADELRPVVLTRA